MIPIVNLEWEGDPPSAYCPACGSVIFDENGEGKWCKHIIFTNVDVCQDYSDISIELQQKAIDYLVKNDHVSLSDGYTFENYLSDSSIELGDLLSKVIDSESAFIMSLTTSGYGCGCDGSSSSILVGIEFNVEKES